MKTWGYFTICIVSLAWASAATGATLHVDAGGGGSYTSIQAALDAAVTGHDKIEVNPGTYYEAIDFHGKAVRLYSKHGPTETIIDGTGSYHVVRCTSGEGPDTILEGFTITGGNANGVALEDASGGGMYNSGTNPAVANCVFTGNTAHWGGAMFNNLASPCVTNCVFRDNSADQGGAMLSINLIGLGVTGCASNGEFAPDGSDPTLSLNLSGPVLTDCTFEDNSALDGGGMFNYNSPALTGCTFNSNSAVRGGAMFNETASPVMSGCTFYDNSASQGGGIFNGLAGAVAATDCTFRNNQADCGGGICNDWFGHATMVDCIFTENRAIGAGGAIGSGRGVVDATGCTFAENTAGAGGAVFCGEGGGTVSNSTFHHNYADNGGAMANAVDDVLVTNCIFIANGAVARGGAISNTWNDLVATHCTFSGNIAQAAGGAIASEGIGYTTTVTNCILWSDVGGELDSGFATLVVTYSDIEGGWDDEGNIDADPRFAGADGDFHLLSDSPCIDAGTNDPPGGLPVTDIEGNPRPVDGNGDGVAVADMGAYELPAKVKKARKP